MLLLCQFLNAAEGSKSHQLMVIIMQNVLWKQQPGMYHKSKETRTTNFWDGWTALQDTSN